MTNKQEREWYYDANTITSLMIGIIVLLLISSQAFAIRNQMGIEYMLRSLFNYNSFYLIFLAYFVLLKTKIGKRYFNIMNLVLLSLEILVLFGSAIDVIQFFSLSTIFALILNLILFIYMAYVYLKDTRIWNMFHLDALQIQIVKNSQFFITITSVSLIILLIELITSIEFDHVVLKMLECLFIVGYTRFLYLYQDYKEKKQEITEKEENRVEEVIEENKVVNEERVVSNKIKKGRPKKKGKDNKNE